MHAIGQPVMTPLGPRIILQIDTTSICDTSYQIARQLGSGATANSGWCWVGASELSFLPPEPTTRERIDAVLVTLATMQVELAAIQATLTPEEQPR